MHTKRCRSKKGLDRVESREISVSWRSGCPSRSTLNPLSNFTTSQLLTQHSPLNQQTTVHRELLTRHPTNTPFLLQPFPGKRTATAFYVRLDRKPQVLRYVAANPPTTSGPDRRSPRLDSVARTSFALTQGICSGCFSKLPTPLSCESEMKRRPTPPPRLGITR